MGLSKFFTQETVDALYQKYVYEQVRQWALPTPHDWQLMRKTRKLKHRGSQKEFELSYFILYSWKWAMNTSITLKSNGHDKGEVQEHEFTIAIIPGSYKDISPREVAKLLAGEEIVVVAPGRDEWQSFYHIGQQDEAVSERSSLSTHYDSMSVVTLPPLVPGMKMPKPVKLSLDFSEYSALTSLCS